ncbi:hypothetical protein GM418_24845 [Maribellus comscasis]|uniref:Photosynthesis system II assembly factor Ycf48/Hcf136-like domain-containing protein n=1 Tax=Maribellus comscasis TaxID=2681766 RepID=A0A6I6K2N4_9BACT|nr:hypothetical protein [Maribellus comscasis]QGY46767.1 hypothetical protein GM418_24845 [Maribellus comscasis]
MRNFILLFLVTILISCNAQTKEGNKKVADKNDSSRPSFNSPKVTSEGIVYFSFNNGLSWENKSEGLPDSVSFGLGAIAASDHSLGITTKEKGVYFFDFQKDLWVGIPTDKKIIESNPGALCFFKEQIVVGTQKGGVFFTADQGKSWININSGLTSLSIRKLVQIGDKLYTGTNAGLFSYNETGNHWELEYGNNTMQVNGITESEGNIYIGSNQGAFTTPKDNKAWTQILANHSLHNISSDENIVYAMVYNELLSSTDKGLTWKNVQKGLPAELYTFNVVKNGNSVFAGQWDGVYKREMADENWKSYSSGLPEKLAITNMKSYNGIIVASGSERGLKKGMNTDRLPGIE